MSADQRAPPRQFANDVAHRPSSRQRQPRGRRNREETPSTASETQITPASTALTPCVSSRSGSQVPPVPHTSSPQPTSPETTHDRNNINKARLGNVPCRYFHQGYCSRGPKCWFSHEAPPGRTTVDRPLIASVRELERPEDEECGICFDRVTGEYGLLECCDHVFCLDCIRAWRTTHKAPAPAADFDDDDPNSLLATSKTCPMCRTRTRYIIPSLVFPYPPRDGTENELKKTIVHTYLKRLASIPCRYFTASQRAIEKASNLPQSEQANTSTLNPGSVPALPASPMPRPPGDGQLCGPVPAGGERGDGAVVAGEGSAEASGEGESTALAFPRLGVHARKQSLPLCPFFNDCHYKHVINGEKFTYSERDLSRARRLAKRQREMTRNHRAVVERLNNEYQIPNGVDVWPPFVIQVLLAQAELARAQHTITGGTGNAAGSNAIARREEPIALLPPDADIDQDDDDLDDSFDVDSVGDWEHGNFNDDFEMGLDESGYEPW